LTRLGVEKGDGDIGGGNVARFLRNNGVFQRFYCMNMVFILGEESCL
jgi:hypothetical protein